MTALPLLDEPLTAADAARRCAAWAASGEFGDHVVYERSGTWIFAARPVAHIILTRGRVSLDVGSEVIDFPWTDDPSAGLEAALAALPDRTWQLYGWVGFDYCAAYRGLLDHVPHDVVLAHFIVPGLIVRVNDDGIDADGADEEILTRLQEIASRADDPAPARPIDVAVDGDGYSERVAQAIAEINSGAYQKVILSRRVAAGYDVDIPATYVRGRDANTPARSFLLRLGGVEAAGFSPELVGAVDQDGIVTAEPLAGTRALTGAADVDAAARTELLSDEKELAEHALSVRACLDEVDSVVEPGTAHVASFLDVRERGSVQHLGATVRGRLAPGLTPWRALEALFPSITATGTPKTPALEAIYRLEPERRGPYSGAVVAASSAGDLEAALALRSVFAEDGRAWLRAGAGIVAGSQPDREFTETCEKLASIAPFVVPATES
ncbi:salicylate synthase [Gordonia zhaorongruii]|uniref:salicylate synthase n=1 Tax=Gordonia zhaorongruii TaxID=2597659 RepID=UPI00104C33D7|nr:salicylate synthase [Gordonia zhaorongruii]